MEKPGLKLNIQKMKIVASSPFISSQIDGETKETVTDFIFLGSKFTVDGDCSHEIKRRSFLGRKAMRNLDSILKSIDISLLINTHLVKAMGFPVVMYGCESWRVMVRESSLKTLRRRTLEVFLGVWQETLGSLDLCP